MPTYTFENTTTGERFEKVMKISEFDDFRENNPDLKSVITGAPSLGDPMRLGLKKPHPQFRDVLTNIKHNHKRNNINNW